MERGKTTRLTIAWVCDKIFVPSDPFQCKNNIIVLDFLKKKRIVLDWTARTDHSHGASADDVHGTSKDSMREIKAGVNVNLMCVEMGQEIRKL